jgi:hypothetical protein
MSLEHLSAGEYAIGIPIALAFTVLKAQIVRRFYESAW